ncbi:MAG: hypothetical protein HY303_12075 [Candidatus Wallbacteria bacterium]|nr:hypothetical protein [Candidatus Wallbacteria bacterium]
MIVFNAPGIAMFVVCFGLASGVCGALGATSEAVAMLVAGPLLAICDLAYRARLGAGRWFKSEAGGSLFLLPAWILGCVWFLLGILYTFRGRR